MTVQLHAVDGSRCATVRGVRRPRSHLDTWAAAARRQTGPLYAAVGASSAYQAGWGTSGRQVSLSLEHRSGSAALRVETADHEAWAVADERGLLVDWALAAVDGPEPTFPLTLTADRWEQQVLVDGRPHRFVLVGSSSAWVGAGEVLGRAVSLHATGWPHEGLALQTVLAADVVDRPRALGGHEHDPPPGDR